MFVIGDLMAVEGVPGVAQGAIQSARHAANLIAAEVGGSSAPRAPFAYRDKGSMATISKYQAVVSVGRLRLWGFPAWVAWLVLHLLYITGFKQQLTTLLRWFITFIGSGRAERTTTCLLYTSRCV